MTVKATYPDIGVQVDFLTESPVCLTAPKSGARYLTFEEDVTVIPLEGQKGVRTFFPAEEAIPFEDFGDCYLVLGEVHEGYVPTNEDMSAPGPVMEEKEAQRLALLVEAKGYGLSPHPMLGIPKLTEMISKYLAEKKVEEDLEEQKKLEENQTPE